MLHTNCHALHFTLPSDAEKRCSTRHHEVFLAKQNRWQSHGKLSLLSAPGSVLIKTTLMKSPAGAAQTVCLSKQVQDNCCW